jgi:hypothetical protein
MDIFASRIARGRGPSRGDIAVNAVREQVLTGHEPHSARPRCGSSYQSARNLLTETD